MANTVLDIDTLSDEEFMKLDSSQMQETILPEDSKEEPESDESNEDVGAVASTEGDSSDSDSTESTSTDAVEGDESPEPSDNDEEKVTPKEDETPSIPKGKDEKPTESHPTKEPKTEATKTKHEEVKPVKTDPKIAQEFFEKVSAPFKADGRDVQVKTPEDAIRLMQMGVNYSRRMQEMKPLRIQDQMLKTHGLNDPEKLNFLIDLSKGDKGAIKKLLQDYKIDPVDIDTSAEDSPYKANTYQGDPKDLAFDDAIKETLSAEGGRALITDINKDWDPVSKEALRDQPVIFQNLLAQKQSGVYQKIKTELEYQRTMGFLTQVPFLQAYHQVGEAMQKAGVFDEPKAQPTKVVGTGTRKAAPKPKIEQPTPNISSATPPRSAPANAGGQHAEPDYSSMSDEEFKKLAPPS